MLGLRNFGNDRTRSSVDMKGKVIEARRALVDRFVLDYDNTYLENFVRMFRHFVAT